MSRFASEPPEPLEDPKTMVVKKMSFHRQRPQMMGFTIDGETSLDLDDAIWIDPAPDGSEAIVWVHIADVAATVAKDSAIDQAAIRRTQTRYLADQTDPMLPRSLAEDQLSLLEGQQRATLTVCVRLDRQAAILSTDIFESEIATVQRFSYQQAEVALRDQKAPLHQVLKACQDWSSRLRQRREARGALGGILTDTGYLDEEGRLIDHCHRCEMIIMEFMILANQAVAEWLARRDIPALYRNHTTRQVAPDRATILKTLLSLGSTEAIRQQLQNWVNPAEYNPYLIGHYALNLIAYTHFTSPIRRVADLINHRIVKATLKGHPSPYSLEELTQLCNHLNACKEQTKLFFKNIHEQKCQSRLETPEELINLSPKEFTLLLKYACKQENLSPIQAEIIRRLERSQLSLQDYYFLLIKGDDQALKSQIFEQLQLQDIPSLLTLACSQTPDWDNFAYAEERHANTFWASLEIAIDTQTLTSPHWASYSNKAGARHRACREWLTAYLSDTLVTPEQRQSLPISPEPVPIAIVEEIPLEKTENFVGENFVGKLHEFCQIKNWERPHFEFVAQAEEFICTCGLKEWEATGAGRRKQDAKQQAAAAMLNVLGQLAEIPD